MDLDTFCEKALEWRQGEEIGYVLMVFVTGVSSGAWRLSGRNHDLVPDPIVDKGVGLWIDDRHVSSFGNHAPAIRRSPSTSPSVTSADLQGRQQRNCGTILTRNGNRLYVSADIA